MKNNLANSSYTKRLKRNKEINLTKGLVKSSYTQRLKRNEKINLDKDLAKSNYTKRLKRNQKIKLAKGLATYLPKLSNTYLYTYPLPSPYHIPDMDTTSAKRNLRANITRKYDERVAATTEKLDPHLARAKLLLKDVKDGEILSLIHI